MQLNTRFRLAAGSIALIGGAGTLLVACSGSSTYHQSGYTSGTYPYCSYYKDGSGIHLNHQSLPCVVGDSHLQSSWYSHVNTTTTSTRTATPKPTKSKKSLFSKLTGGSSTNKKTSTTKSKSSIFKKH